jgi:hypothetical protein
MSDGIRPEVAAVIQNTVQVTLHAQEARKELTLERLDNMVPHLLELEKASRQARAAISQCLQVPNHARKGVN